MIVLYWVQHRGPTNCRCCRPAVVAGCVAGLLYACLLGPRGAWQWNPASHCNMGHLRLTRAPPMARRHPSGLVGAGRRRCRPPPRAWLRIRLRFLPNDENVYCDTDSGWQYLVRHPPSAQGGRSTRHGCSWRRVSYLPRWPRKYGAYWCLPWCPSGAAELESLSLFLGGWEMSPFFFTLYQCMGQ